MTSYLRILPAIILITMAATGFSLQAFGNTNDGPAVRILLIPLDDRPPCLQFPVRMAEIGNAEVVSPPRSVLGSFTDPGEPDKMIEWLKTQDLTRFDAAIISLDMLAYGGLVASRVHGATDSATAARRIEVIRELRKRSPKLAIYGQSVIMRLAPTGDGKNESYRQNLADWAEFSGGSDEQSRTAAARLEKAIPADALDDYKRARKRNLAINLKAVDLVRDGTIDYLILSQDDAKPRGIHVADREKLIAETKRLSLGDKIAVQPGTDEVAMLLLARALNRRFDFSPKVKAVYSSAELSNKAMPFEDRPLRETVRYHIKAAGAVEAASETDADLLFYVYASRFEPGRARSFAAEIAAVLKQGKRVVVADIDPKGDVQGADPAFADELIKGGMMPLLAGYASWNTAGNTIGTALPQGLIFALSQEKLPGNLESINAQNWFTIHRVVDDYLYHTIVRSSLRTVIREKKWSTLILSDEATREVESAGLKSLQKHFDKFAHAYFGRGGSKQKQPTKCSRPSGLSFDLPWNRIFEAEIDFKLDCRVRSSK